MDLVSRDTASKVNRRLIRSIDAFADAWQIGGIVPSPLRPGPIRANLLLADFGSIVAYELDCAAPLAFQGRTIADRTWLVVPLSPAGLGQLNGEPLTRGDLLAFGGSVEVMGASGAPLRWRMLSITSAAIERAATAFGVEANAPAEGELRVTRVADGSRLSGTFKVLSDVVQHQSDVMLTKLQADGMEHTLLQIVAYSLEGDSNRSYPLASARLNSARVAHGCEDYARGLRYQNVTLSDLCHASGVSERRVRSAFYECFQMSPTAYLRVAALNAVRHQLLYGPYRRDTVSRAATDWGFWHLSRFAGQYRALFGESPSNTVARRLDRAQSAAN